MLTLDQSQQHFPLSHCLNLTCCHSGQHHPTDLYYRVSIMIYVAPQGLYSKTDIGVDCHLSWTGREIDDLRPQLFGVVGGYWLGGWSTVPTAEAVFLSANMGPPAALTFRVLLGEQSCFLYLRPRDSAKTGCLTGVPGCL